MPTTAQIVRSSRNSKSAHSPKEKTRSRTQTPERPEQNGVAAISPAGDLVLLVDHPIEHNGLDKISTETGNVPGQCSYRVDSGTLKDASPYFARLLDPDKFGEGSLVAEKHLTLRQSGRRWDAIPVEELPHLEISHVGRISRVKSIRLLMTDFLNVLHDVDLSNVTPPIANIANLAIVADRFDALPALRKYVKSRKLIQVLDGKIQDRATKSTSEEKVRQRLLVGLLLENQSMIWHNSARLIQRGWVGHEGAEDSPLWCDLPLGIEEELLFRRGCILDTIQSIQSHFLGLYISRDRQCKLGYDSSAECDSYQLGQMIRFFRRVGTLDLGGLLLPAAYTEDALPEPFDGDISDLIDSLRQCPEYQIDKNHSHCGLRTRLMPLLEMIEYSLTEVGICGHCWQDCRNEYAWSRVKKPLSWKRDSVGASMYKQYMAQQAQDHLFKHLDTRDLFMAKERLWTS